ncbi:hypothetical protein HN51_040335 [Arachis hypogaea]|uniref:fructose-1,6-bisphosphatase, cytosolic-like isoform X2 n=1 Tax=Arachis hypogaea TaxID=3818 RepID=UPI003B21D060
MLNQQPLPFRQSSRDDLWMVFGFLILHARQIQRIFGIYMLKDEHEPTLEDVLQPGKNMLAAGYCMYSSSCTLVLLLIIGPGMGTSCHGRN